MHRPTTALSENVDSQGRIRLQFCPPTQRLYRLPSDAWAAGTSFALLQAMLGFQPQAHESVLYLDPWLTSWLPDITLHDLRIGKETFDIRFEGSASDTTVTVLRGDPSKVQRRPSVEGSDRLRSIPAAVSE